jgi:hypothetical protein
MEKSGAKKYQGTCSYETDNCCALLMYASSMYFLDAGSKSLSKWGFP